MIWCEGKIWYADQVWKLLNLWRGSLINNLRYSKIARSAGNIVGDLIQWRPSLHVWLISTAGRNWAASNLTCYTLFAPVGHYCDEDFQLMGMISFPVSPARSIVWVGPALLEYKVNRKSWSKYYFSIQKFAEFAADLLKLLGYRLRCSGLPLFSTIRSSSRLIF